MEPILLLFLLSTIDKNPDLKEKLHSFLVFYKENRDLFAMLAGAQKGAPEPEKTPDTEQKENRPSQSEKDGSVRILEEYLKRCAG